MVDVKVSVEEEGPLQGFPVEDPLQHGSRVEEGSSEGPIEGHG